MFFSLELQEIVNVAALDGWLSTGGQFTYNVLARENQNCFFFLSRPAAFPKADALRRNRTSSRHRQSKRAYSVDL